MEKFDTSDEFFDWFLPTLEGYVPNYKELVINAPQAAMQGVDNHRVIASKLPTLTSDEVEYVFEKVREAIAIPNDVFLVYEKELHTYASGYNARKKRLEIYLPTYVFYHLRYDPIIRAAIQHEMGHILNRDYKVITEKGHSGCANRCMDIRINHHIDRDELRDLFNAVYYFKVESFTMLVPEEVLPSYGIPLRKHGTYSYQVIHKYYHLNDKDKVEPKPKPPKPPKVFNLPKVGDIVKINKTSDYGRVIDVKDAKAVVEKMTVEEVSEHFKEIEDTGSYSSI
jgi:hypothetical protein